MLDLQKIAVTGGLAAGKSSLCEIFQELGAYVISADSIVRELLSQNSSYAQNVTLLLGKEVVTNGTIDRKKVADIVFQSDEKLQKLEQLTHPLVREGIQRSYEKAKQEGKYSLFVVEMPLLFETEDPSWYNATIAVVCDEKIAMKHFSEKTGYDKWEYLRRMKRQIPQAIKASRATYTIENNSTIEDFKKRAIELYTEIVSRKGE
jgi:dephospho-CoA kinase